MNTSDALFATQHRAAMEASIVALVRALHEAEVLPIDDFIHVLDGTSGIARAAFNAPRNPVLEVLIGHFKEMSEAYKRA